MLQIIKLSTKTWKHIDTNDGAFILTKFYAKEEFNEFLIVESYGAKRRKYLINEIEVYDIGGTAETFANFEDLFLRLEALKYTGFYKDGDIDLVWGSITGNLSDQTDLQNALDSKVDKVTTAGVERVYTINADGSQGTKATSSFKEVIEGYFNGTNFYTDSGFTNLITPESSKIYLNIAVTPATQYRWSGSAYVQIGGGNSENLLQVKGFATDFPLSNLIGTSAPMSNIALASGTADYNKNLIGTTETGHTGLVALRSSASINSGFCFFYGGTIVNNGDKHVFFTQFKLPTVTDVKGYVGLHLSTTTVEPTTACFLEIVNNSGVFKTRGSSLTTASTSFTLNSNTWYNLMIEFKSTTEVYFKIKLDNGTVVADFTSTTNLPLFSVAGFSANVNIFSTVATTARDLMLLDYVEYRPEKPNHLKSF